MSLNLEKARILIIQRANQLFTKLIAKRGHDNPPFSPEEYAYLLGINKIDKVDLGKTSGVLIRLSDGPIIKLNKHHNYARQNFSCAHEIGHILFNELKLEKYVYSIEYRTFNPTALQNIRTKAIEKLCDISATELLMPESVFIKYLAGLGTSIYSIERIANIFQVSVRAAARRIAEVSIEPCVVMIWQALYNKNSLTLSICEGPGMSSTNINRYSPKSKKIKPPSTIYKAYEQDNYTISFKEFKLGNDVKRMPIESKGFGYGDSRFVVSLAFPER